ncbi:MAG: hypothetical protein HYV63_18445 [Candidatus Schekmanbacteria bacterium]|nr:hypothetical protein [Candidatus Schekmanbacteria bacterium]
MSRLAVEVKEARECVACELWAEPLARDQDLERRVLSLYDLLFGELEPEAERLVVALGKLRRAEELLREASTTCAIPLAEALSALEETLCARLLQTRHRIAAVGQRIRLLEAVSVSASCWHDARSEC